MYVSGTLLLDGQHEPRIDGENELLRPRRRGELPVVAGDDLSELTVAGSPCLEALVGSGRNERGIGAAEKTDACTFLLHSLTGDAILRAQQRLHLAIHRPALK